MRVLALPALLALFLAAPVARADLYLGLMANSGLNGVNIEWAGEAGSFWMLVGSYQASTGFETDNLTGLLGYRRFLDGKYNRSGFFGGFFAGDVDGGTDYNRYGAGGEVGYQWVTTDLRMTLHTGVALAGEATGDNVPPGDDVKPVSIIGASASLRF